MNQHTQRRREWAGPPGVEHAPRPRAVLLVPAAIVLVALVAALGLAALHRVSGGASAGAVAANPRAGGVELCITHDFGAGAVANRHCSITASATVMQLLTASEKVETGYGGGFVDSIDGIASGFGGGGSAREDWFYYVNGMLARVGAADRPLGSNDRVWWDFHPWDFAASVPAVVGQYPEPFVSGADGTAFPTQVVFAPAFADDAIRIARALRAAGVSRISTAPLTPELRPPRSTHIVLVGTWTDLARLPWIAGAAENPGSTGLFARFDASGVALLGEHGQVAARKPAAGAVLATALGEDPSSAVWLVTGSEAADVVAAASLVAEKPSALDGRFGVVVERTGAVVALPAGARR